MNEVKLSKVEDGDFFRYEGALYRRIVSLNELYRRPNDYVLCFAEETRKVKTIHETHTVRPAPNVSISIAIPTSKELGKL